MTAVARQPAQDAPQSTSALLVSLSHLLPRDHALARRARRLAHRLNQHSRPPRTLALAGAELLAQMLEATDDECETVETGDFELHDADWDSDR